MYGLHKRDLEFVWDPAKESANRRKHGISFVEAATAFLDESASLFHDPDEAGDEDRYILIGLSDKTRLLVICHCYRGQESTIRIISARRADRRETIEYART